MINVSKVSKAYGGTVILRDINLSLAPGNKVALVGRNGAGKTTLLKILAGALAPDQGVVTLAPGARVGMLGQEGQLDPDRTLYAEMLEVFARVFAMEAELRELEQRMSELEGRALDECFSRYSTLQAAYDHAEGHTVDARIRTVLAGMGFRPSDLERPCREFSGGWQMRAAMARLLLTAPTLLLLDEPTNHLDISAVEWLEQYLAEYSGTVVLVSHDRYFMDRCINRTIELVFGELEDYRGNYTFYLEEAERRFELQQAAHEAQQKKLEHDQRFIERFRYKATLATRVKSREKALEKLERIDAPKADDRRMHVSFAPVPQSGRDAVVVKGVHKAYGDLQVLRGIDLRVERGDRVAFVGRNGAGKSTLLRLLAGLESPDKGTVNPGFKLQPVYYAQNQADILDPSHTVLESLERVAPPSLDQTRLRSILGCLLFTGDDVHKKVGVLSGGERSRVALARCIVEPSNVLLLDEPTNHLDIAARDSLLEALADYEGSILLISHDRHFMDGLVTKIVEIADGEGTETLGTYSVWREKKARSEAAQAATAKKSPPASSGQGKAGGKGATSAGLGVAGKASQPGGGASSGTAEASPGAPARTTKRTVTWKIDALEKKIFGLETEITQLQERMALPEVYSNHTELHKVQGRLAAAQQECDELMAQWEEVAAQS